MSDNHEQVTRGFRLLLSSLAPYMAREFSLKFGDDWWYSAVLDVLYEEQQRDLPESGTWEEIVDSLDIARCLLLFDLHWNEIFRRKLSIDNRTWAKELVGVRNRLAHLGGEDFSDDDTWRALDTMSRLCEPLDTETAEEIRSLLRSLRYGSAYGSMSSTTTASNTSTLKQTSLLNAGILNTPSASGLPSWRDVIEPHPDVAQGRYRNAEFAADLAQVARGEGAFEYLDPVEFFARTYVTEGMAGLLEQALRRVGGKDGEPVFQLKTAFGGGKTHSMLALYHLLGGKVSLEKIPNVAEVLERAGLTSLPRVNIAVLVGTAFDLTTSKRPALLPGVTVNTLWGEMAAQLAIASGKPQIYDFIKEADKKGVSPGSEALKNLFDSAAPCLVLMDELVAYAKKLYGIKGLAAGTFDNFITFIQEVTEAVRASKNSLVVASIPESEPEIGGEAGQIALKTIEHTFGRMESIWKPVTANEGFEVVRRRLFLECKDPAQRDAVCNAYAKFYNVNASDFPVESRNPAYRERLLSCYPIHPEVFDRLYEDWATLERFQRTRGVLRLMAAVIHELWMGNDSSLMIMTGSIPFDIPSVRDELTRHLSENWNAVVDREVDGKASIPYQLDQSTPRFGTKLIARRVARAIMLGSAPSERSQSVRGVEAARIRLGVAQPDDTIGNFNDVLSTLEASLAYLYKSPSQDRYWYDTRPTLRKTVNDKAVQLPLADVDYEIEQRLRKLRREEPFTGLHICPASSQDVPDEQSVRLVILGADKTFTRSEQQNVALQTSTAILDSRGNASRIYRNMLIFMAPDAEQIKSVREAVRLYLAWQWVKQNKDELNLDAGQNKTVEESLREENSTVDSRLKEAYCWLLVPGIDKNTSLNQVNWESNLIGGNEEIIRKAVLKVKQDEAIITMWAPILLRSELDSLLWRDKEDINLKVLWEQFSQYLYLPRLMNEEVLHTTIRAGLNSTEYFALAAGKNETRYIDLKYNQQVSYVDRSAYLVHLETALKQIFAEQKQEQMTQEPIDNTKELPSLRSGESTISWHIEPPSIPNVKEEGQGQGMQVREEARKTIFSMTAELDPVRVISNMQDIMNEIINRLLQSDGSEVKLTLEVQATMPKGLTQEEERAVRENSQTLKIKYYNLE